MSTAPFDAEGKALGEAMQVSADALKAALISGRSTGAARAELARTQAALDALDAKIAAARERAAAERAGDIYACATSHIHAAEARFLAAAAAIPTPTTEVAVPLDAIVIPDEQAAALAAAANHLARSERELAEAADAANQARAEARNLEERIADLDHRRASIGARRAAGTVKPGDGAELELLALDREGLADLLGAADARFTAAHAAEEERRRVVPPARAALARVEAAIRRDHFTAQAATLAAALTRTIKELNASANAAGNQRPTWKASETLKEQLRRLDLGILD